MVKFTALVAASIALLLPAAVIARPNGAPKCAINPDAIRQAHANIEDLGATLSVEPKTYTPGGGPITITIGGGVAYQGMLAYITPGKIQDSLVAAAERPKAHVGKFTLPAGLRAQTVSACTEGGILNDADESTITHSAPFTDATRPLTLTWTPPATEMGPVTINMALSTGGPSAKMTFVNAIQIESAGGAGAVNAAPAPGNNTVAVPPTSPRTPNTCPRDTSAG
ncbi:hypothetical protein BC829DRAFT_434578 [Chytridium lagenaria]|nr:hypothetical protein BC829DRAFT_434578 [Chytridium lagenaria]